MNVEESFELLVQKYARPLHDRIIGEEEARKFIDTYRSQFSSLIIRELNQVTDSGDLRKLTLLIQLIVISTNAELDETIAIGKAFRKLIEILVNKEKSEVNGRLLHAVIDLLFHWEALTDDLNDADQIVFANSLAKLANYDEQDDFWYKTAAYKAVMTLKGFRVKLHVIRILSELFENHSVYEVAVETKKAQDYLRRNLNGAA